MSSHLLPFIYKDDHAPRKLGGGMNSLEDIVQTSSAVILRGKIELQIMVNSHHISTL